MFVYGQMLIKIRLDQSEIFFFNFFLITELMFDGI